MKTRGKVKGDTWNVDYAKDGSDNRDLLDDGADVNGYSEEKTDDVSLCTLSANVLIK